jgi:hypothetical protein
MAPARSAAKPADRHLHRLQSGSNRAHGAHRSLSVTASDIRLERRAKSLRNGRRESAASAPRAKNNDLSGKTGHLSPLIEKLIRCVINIGTNLQKPTVTYEPTISVTNRSNYSLLTDFQWRPDQRDQEVGEEEARQEIGNGDRCSALADLPAEQAAQARHAPVSHRRRTQWTQQRCRPEQRSAAATR